jgi:hypothetical protein
MLPELQASCRSLVAERKRAFVRNCAAGMGRLAPGGREEMRVRTRDTSAAEEAPIRARVDGSRFAEASGVGSLYGRLGLSVCISILFGEIFFVIDSGELRGSRGV